MRERLTNFARTTLAKSMSALDTTFTLANAEYFPSENFYVVIDAANSSHEIVWVVSRDGNVFNCVTTKNRGLKGTAAVDHRNGALVIHTILAHHVEESIKNSQVFLPGRPQGTLIKEYDFSSGLGDWVISNGTAEVVGGALRLSGSSSATAIAKAPSVPSNLDRYEISFDFKQLDKGLFGCIFRGEGSDIQYVHIHDVSSRWNIKTYNTISGSATIISDNVLPVNPNIGSYMRMLIRYSLGEVSVYIDDVLVSLSTMPSRNLASSMIFRASTNRTIEYRNIKIYSLPSSWTPSWRGGKVDSIASQDVSEWNVDLPPVQPHPLDDEFDGTELSPEWMLIGTDSGGHKVGDGKLVVHSIPNGTSWNSYVIAKPSPLGDFSVTTKMDVLHSIDGPGGTIFNANTLTGLGVRNSANGRMIHMGDGLNGNNLNHRIQYWTAVNAATTTLHNRADIVGYQYQRIRKVGANLFFDVSKDGLEWMCVWGEALATRILAVDQVIVLADFNRAADATRRVSVTMDYIRFSNETGANEKLLGQEVYLDRAKLSLAESVDLNDGVLTDITGPNVQEAFEDLDNTISTKLIRYNNKPNVGDLLRVKSIDPLVVEGYDPLPSGIFEGALEGYYSLPGVSISSISTYTPSTPGSIYYYPIVLNEKVLLDHLAIEVTGGSSSSRLITFGLYESDRNLQPKGLIISGEVPAISSGVKTVDFNGLVGPGLYLSFIMSNSTSIAYRVARTIRNNYLMFGSGEQISSLRADIVYGEASDPGVPHHDYGRSSAAGYPVWLKIGEP